MIIQPENTELEVFEIEGYFVAEIFDLNSFPMRQSATGLTPFAAMRNVILQYNLAIDIRDNRRY